MECNCGSDLDIENCCKPLLEGTRSAQTAEELMRSRYVAYTRADVAYIVRTTHPDTREKCDRESIRNWAKGTDWQKLEILHTKQGMEEDNIGYVEFIAHFIQDGVRRKHRELSKFVKCDGNWFFVDGKIMCEKPIQMQGMEKIGRNEPCPCASGKKYKKCCGRAN